MLSRHEILDKLKRHGSSGDAFLRSMTGVHECEDSAQGSWVFGDQGGKYLDFGSFAVFLFGHSPRAYVESLTAQLYKLAGSTRAFLNGLQATAYEALASLAPEGLSKVMLLNSGAEAVEAALKLACVKTGRSTFMHLSHSYHGKTCGALALTDASVFQAPFRELLPRGFTVLPRDDAELAGTQIRQIRPAAVFVEAIQGEGGIYELRDSYLQEIRRACDEAGSLLIADEIQAGLGRSGETWAFAKSGITPDVILCGKALGGGIIAVAGLIAKVEAFRPFDQNPILHSSTLAANPLACCAVKTTVATVQEQNIPQKAAALGERLSQILGRLQTAYPQLFAATSGRGLMQGLHCTEPRVAAYFIRHCLSHGLIVTPCLSRPRVVRLSPPACLGSQELYFAEAALIGAAMKTAQECPQPERNLSCH